MKSNCIIYALSRWLRQAPPGEECYLVIRRSRVPWGILHVLHGTLDPATGQIAVTSYKPPEGHRKTGVQPLFHGRVVQGDGAGAAPKKD